MIKFERKYTYRKLAYVVILALAATTVFYGVRSSFESQRLMSQAQILRDESSQIEGQASQLEIANLILGDANVNSLLANSNSEVFEDLKTITGANLKNMQERTDLADKMRETAAEADREADESEKLAWSTDLFSTMIVTFGSVLLGGLLGDSLRAVWLSGSNIRSLKK